MNRLLVAITTVAVVVGAQLPVRAGPPEDLEAFQNYFRKKFSNIPFDDFANSAYALPQAKEARAQWEEMMRSPQYEPGLERGKKFWEDNDLASCFKNNGRNIAQHYPYWDDRTKMVRTVELDINECLKRKAKEPLDDLKKGTMAEVAAYMKSLSRGQRVKVTITGAALEAYEEGRRFYWAKRGQLNLSCADCHVQNAGKQFGADFLSPGLGHTVGYPSHRAEWGELGTLHWRYASCTSQMGAAPFRPQSRQYRHLEFYETYLQQGLPLTAPSLRR